MRDEKVDSKTGDRERPGANGASAAGRSAASPMGDRHEHEPYPFAFLSSLSASLLLLIALVPGCARPPQSGGSKAPSDPQPMETWGRVDLEDLEYPEQLGTYSLVRFHDYREVELGVQLTYADSSHPRATLDVYVYPISKPDKLSLTAVLDWEMRSTALGMAVVAKQRGFEAGEPRGFPSGLSGEDEPTGLGVVRLLSSPDRELLTMAYLTVRDHRFFKLRMTFPREALGSEGDSYFQEVIDALLPAIRLRPPVTQPVFDITVFRNVFLAPQHESCNLAGWLAYGLEMSKQIEKGKYLDSFSRELAARKAALEFWRDKQAGKGKCPSDVLEMMALADEAGFLDEYVFEAYGNPLWPEPDGLRMQEWMNWSKANIRIHDPVVEPGIAIEWQEKKKDGGDPVPAGASR